MPSLLPQNSHMGGYRVVRLLGKGGMAEVYEVECEKTGAPYALKVFVCEQANAVFLKKRFLAEGRLLAKLRHPRLVHVYDFGYLDETALVSPYFVMDLVETALGSADGSLRPVTLKDALALGLTTEERLVGWYGDLLEALNYVHAHDVIHRDVSLENVLIAPDGRAVLSDFGVARVVDRDLRTELNLSVVTMMTEGQPLMGKSFYLAPEVRAGRPATAAADLYALGVMFFYLLNQVWYTPGARVTDLLGLFDEQWQRILPTLLAEDPVARKALPWKEPRERELADLRKREEVLLTVRARLIRRVRWCIVGGTVAFAVCTVLFLRTLSSSKSYPENMPQSAPMFSSTVVKDAGVFCTLPRSILQGDGPETRRLYEAIRPMARCYVESVLAEAGKSKDWEFAGDQLCAMALNLDNDVQDSACEGICLFCLQAAFRLYLRQEQWDKAAFALSRIESLDSAWADDLQKTLATLLSDPSKYTEFNKAWASQNSE